MKGPGIWAGLVLPSFIIGVALVLGLALSGHYWWAALFVPSTLVAFVVTRFMWGR